MSQEACLTIMSLLNDVETVDEVKQLYSALNLRFRTIKHDDLTTKVLSGELRVGGKVKFTDKRGNTVHGVVQKINNKNVEVKEMRSTLNGLSLVTCIWTVSPVLLQKDE